MFDLNNCTIEYMYNGSRNKKRAIRHLSGKDAEDLNTYIIVTATSKRLLTNTTGDSFYSYITNKFKNDNVNPFADYQDILDKYKEVMPRHYLDELEKIEKHHQDFLEGTDAISKNAQAFEILNGKKIIFTEFKIPTENFIKRNIDIKY